MAAPVANDASAGTGRPNRKSLPARLASSGCSSLKEFFGFGGDATYLWPRWIVLRAVGLVYLFIFAGIIIESRAILGPDGVAPLTNSLSAIRHVLPGAGAEFLAAPSLFWLNRSPGMIAMIQWVGFVAALALVFNFWPRAALAICWVTFLSFVSTWAEFSPAQLDRLMLETALLCIPFAPRGLRPGLGEDSPPMPVAICLMRWLLFRVMFESGLVKLVSTDPHWRAFTAMDVMYETAPSPTILGYWAHQLPHPYHVFEVAFTFVAELMAPIVAIFGGRRGRWFALLTWTALQIRIQLTCNFGWLNTAGIALGLMLLDDQMLRRAIEKIGIRALDQLGAPSGAAIRPGQVSGWGRYGLRAAFGVHFCLTLYYFADVCGVKVSAAPPLIAAAVEPFVGFKSANGYFLYAYFPTAHHQVDFEGSNDGGKTWRTYLYRHIPQQADRISPFLAPWFARFEATIQVQGWTFEEFSVIPLVATRLLARSPAVIERFVRDPFPDRPPTVIRMRRYRLTFTDHATLGRTGHYWRKEFDRDYTPALYVNEQGAIIQFDLAEADAAMEAENYTAAFTLCEQQFRRGNLEAAYRLADMYVRGAGVPAQPGKAFALFSELAGRGEIRARHNLGLCYQYGVGVPVDYRKAADEFRNSAERGSLLSLYALGALAAGDHLVPRNDIEGLSALLRAAARTDDDPSVGTSVREDAPAQTRRLLERMSADDIAKARAQAAGNWPAN